MTSPVSPVAGGGLAAIGVLLFCVVSTAIGRGTGESYGVFLLPLGADLGWDRGALASVYALYMAAHGVGSPMAGALFDRFGARFIYFLGFVMLGVGYGIAGYITELWQLYLCVGLLGGLGASMVGIVPAQALISRWFDRNLATAMAIGYAGMGMGTLIMAPYAQIAIDNFGWRGAYGAIAVLFAVLLPIALLLPWRRIMAGADGNPRRTKISGEGAGPTLRQVTKTLPFWAFFAIFGFTAVGVFGISLQTVAFLVEQGVGDLEAAGAFGSAGMLSFIGMAATGIAADRFDRRVVATVSYCLTILGIGALWMILITGSFLFIPVFVICFGLSMGARGPILTTMIAQRFAGRGLGAIYGSINLGQGLGAGGGAWLTGALYDWTGGYETGFVVCAFCCVIGIALFWLVPAIRPAKP